MADQLSSLNKSRRFLALEFFTVVVDSESDENVGGLVAASKFS